MIFYLFLQHNQYSTPLCSLLKLNKGKSSFFLFTFNTVWSQMLVFTLQLSSYKCHWITWLECKSSPDKYWLLVTLKWDQVHKSWRTTDSAFVVIFLFLSSSWCLFIQSKSPHGVKGCAWGLNGDTGSL